MSVSNFNKLCRKTVVTKVSVFRCSPNALGFNFNIFKSDKIYWEVHLETKTGLDCTSTYSMPFKKEGKARECATRNYVGKIVDDKPIPEEFKDYHLGGNQVFLSVVLLPSPDLVDFYSNCCEVLVDAGIKSTVFGGGPSNKVLTWLGDEKILKLQNEFKDNWTVMGELEYCLHHFLRASIACRAAEVMGHRFITKNAEAFGYLYRELLLMLGKAESIAISNIETRKKAGKGGGNKSQKSKENRLDNFMKEIEALGDLYPRMSEENIVNQAFDNAVKSNPALWKQGKGQKEEYLSNYIRSEEPYKSKYDNIFNKTA